MAQKTVYTFPSADHVSTIHAVRWLPDEGPVKAVLQIVHGMVEYIERYTPFAEYLTTQGYAVYGHDHIGHGDSVKGPEEWGIMHADDPSDIMVEDMFTNYKHVWYFHHLSFTNLVSYLLTTIIYINSNIFLS